MTKEKEIQLWRRLKGAKVKQEYIIHNKVKAMQSENTTRMQAS